MKIQSEQKPCKCSLCEKDFTDGSTLISHMMAHTGEKLYECN